MASSSQKKEEKLKGIGWKESCMVMEGLSTFQATITKGILSMAFILEKEIITIIIPDGIQEILKTI